jgi:hypothetical protein
MERKKKKNSLKAQTTPDALFGPVLVITACHRASRRCKTSAEHILIKH